MQRKELTASVSGLRSSTQGEGQLKHAVIGMVNSPHGISRMPKVL